MRRTSDETYGPGDTLPMKLTPHELEHIADRTLQHYNESADAFWEGTRGHDVSQNVAALLHHINRRHRIGYRILAADRDVISRPFLISVTSPSAWKVLRASPKWHAAAGTKCGSRTFKARSTAKPLRRCVCERGAV